jgi:hypothetical protein
MTSAHPREVLEVLRLMIVADPEGCWSVLGSVDETGSGSALVKMSGDAAYVPYGKDAEELSGETAAAAMEEG